MSMHLIGTVKNGGVYDVNGKDNTKKQMISFSVVDGLGTVFPCQMWPDDQQFSSLASVIEQYRRHQVQVSIVGYTVRMRQFKNSNEVKPWANFIVSEVSQPPANSLLSASFTGTVKTGGVNPSAGKHGMLWFSAVDEIGTTFPCQMWGDDPHFAELSPIFQNGVRRQQVSFLVASYTLRDRTFPDGHTAPQINFVVSDVSFPALARA